MSLILLDDARIYELSPLINRHLGAINILENMS